MADHRVLYTSSGNEIFVQVAQSKGGARPKKGGLVGSVSAAGAAKKVLATFSDLGDSLAEMSSDVLSQLNKLPVIKRPAEVEVTFAIQVSAEGGVILASLAGEASLEVKATWRGGTEPK